MTDRIEIVQGDITQFAGDAVVNAANSSLLGGGGVDGAIHRAAGPELLAACRRIDGCPAGEARITPGFRLPARWVIHTVGPIWHGGDQDEANLLARCYRWSLELATENGPRTIAFPAISTGAYGYPIDPATRIAIRTVRQSLLALPSMERVTFVCHGAKMFELYQRIAAEGCASGT